MLDITIPEGVPDEAVRSALSDQLAHVFSALLSFAVIGRFWVAHHWLMAKIVEVDAVLLTLNTALLAAIALVPAAAAVLAGYGDLAIATIAYAITVGRPRSDSWRCGGGRYAAGWWRRG